MKLLTVNVCGLRSKLICPEFINYINSADIIGFQETKTDCLDDINLHDYILHFKHRKLLSKRKSGGIALAYKSCLKHYINPIDSPSQLVLWFTISKQLTKTDDILCGIIYIPPECSDYSLNDPYQEIENELHKYTDRYTKIIMFGDYNSRTKDLPDYIPIDLYICSHFQSEELNLEYANELSYFDNSNCCVSIQRTNNDKCVNNFGYKLLEFCKANNLYILNGRTASDKGKGLPTCKGTSTVDYFICSSNINPLISEFFVDTFCPLLSDVHCPVVLELKLYYSKKVNISDTFVTRHEKNQTMGPK